MGTRNILEAGSTCPTVRRVVYASRAGLLSPYPWTLFRTVELPVRPVGNYTCSKAMGEALGYSYAASAGLEVVVIRIGNYRRERTKLSHPHQLGHNDCLDLFGRAVSHPLLHPSAAVAGADGSSGKYCVVFGVSDSNWKAYDLEPGRRHLGFWPSQRSEVPQERIGIGPDGSTGNPKPPDSRHTEARL
eukprot:COSAG05_NODE_2289_length_3270_cov_1.558814_3_plen_188_part_00